MKVWLICVLFLAWASTITATCDSTTQGPIEICFTVDQSGSIDDTEYDELNSFIGDIVAAASLPNGSEFPSPGAAAVVLFATTAKVAVPLTNNATEVLEAVYPRLSSGRTALTEGVDLCVSTLLASTSNLQQVMVVLTDGVNNENSTRTPDEIRIRAEEAGIFVIALAIGDETDPTALRAYLPTKSPVGILYYATDFNTGLQNLISSVITEVNDADEDGVCNDVDVCPGSDDRIDSDGDGTPDGCDICPHDPSIQYVEDPNYGSCGCDGDSDNDGVCNSLDICEGFDDHIDTDFDGTPDGCDACIGDPEIYSITDEKYFICGCDGDDDEDGVCNALDICPGFDDNIDVDEDGHPDACDNCKSIYNPDQADGDKNGVGDACEPDMCEYKHGPIDINASCVHNCGGGRWSNCKDVCALFGVPFVSNVQCNNAGIALDISPPGPYNDRCDRTKVCCMCRPFVNNYPIMKAHLRGPHHRGHVHHGHHEEDCDCDDLLD